MGSLVGLFQTWGPAGVFVLALIDSAGVPLPVGVDALVITWAVLNRETAWAGAVAAVIGSVIGCLVLFTLARKGGQIYLDRYTSEGRGARLRGWFERYGLVTVFVPAMMPIPLPVKVPILCAGALGVPTGRFAVVVLLARVPRYLGLAWLGSRLGSDSLPWLKAHVWHLTAGAVVLFGILFLLAVFRPRADRDGLH